VSQVTSVAEMEQQAKPRQLVVLATTFEVLAIFTCILAYIWRWQHTSPRIWMVLWALILISHVLHRDTLRGLGLGRAEFRASAQWILPLTVLLCLPLLYYGFERQRLLFLHPTWQALGALLGYGSWCAFQQYLTQSYFHNRLMLVIRNRHVNSALIGIMFSATHIPNPILMIATLVAGVVFAEVFGRHRNIWPLALAQAVGGLLLAAVSPESMIHHMRVGPGYFFYGIR
jgi:hypothetical protein